MLFFIWPILGFVVWSYYMFIHNNGAYARAYENGEYSTSQFMIGFFGTILLWPVAIYNNEIRRKR